MGIELNTTESSNESSKPEVVKKTEKAEEEPFFRNTQDKVKFGLEVTFMLFIGFVCTFPLVLFLGNFLR
ncbi:MAG: hypothetical protein ACTSVZ_07655 [Promethearchaeota archaeon]